MNLDQRRLNEKHDFLIEGLRQANPIIAEHIRVMGTPDLVKNKIVRQLTTQLASSKDGNNLRGELEAGFAQGTIHYIDLVNHFNRPDFLNKTVEISRKRLVRRTREHIKEHINRSGNKHTKHISVREYVAGLQNTVKSLKTSRIRRQLKTTMKYKPGTVGYEEYEKPKRVHKK